MNERRIGALDRRAAAGQLRDELVESQVKDIMEQARQDGFEPGAKFCRDCKHHSGGEVYGHFCARFRTPVTGEPTACSRQRSIPDGRCGPEGKGFEPKENK